MVCRTKSLLKSKVYFTFFFEDPIHSVHNGTESVSYIGPKIWEQIPSEIRNKKSWEGFKQEMKNGN